jgi:uncharacterized membrane protein YqjE
MNPASETQTSPPVENTGGTQAVEASLPTNWREALMTLIAARVALIQLESKDAARDTAKRAACIIALILCAFFTWALLLASGIAALARICHWPWYGIAFIAAAFHLIAAILLTRAAKSPAASAFPVTRAEFNKDREWIENFQKTPKSND